ncbi:MAG: TIGR03087 family PEP-CTERM/XrtA system glycosyltransferase [Acidobacteria bacterium]|nr:TIGR03087 family PEP-CTERM/XrtA system glycosyltransferase [Acidobacteriota bacterium]
MKMKLLFLAHRIPYPPNKGDKIRSYHELRALVERGHEVHLLAFADNMRDLHYQVDLARGCASVRIVRLRKFWAKLRALFALLTSHPLSLGYFGSRKMRRLVKRAFRQQEFDAVFVYSSAMAQYIPLSWRAQTIVDLVDVDSEKWHEYAARTTPPKRWIYEVEGRRMRKHEMEIISGFATSILTTRHEAELLDDLDEFTLRARVRIMTNGVDSEYFQPEHSEAIVGKVIRLPLPNSRETPSKPRLVFTGAMDYYANVEAVNWFATEVFPGIRQQEPLAEFLIVGSNPTSEVKKLGEQPGVIVTGTVEDVRPYLREATVCVAPLRIARGIQNKVLEAMACGKAIVATPEAAKSLRVAHEEQLLLASSPSDFASAVIQLIRDDGLRESLGWRARRFVELEHQWHPLLLNFVELLESTAQRKTKTETHNLRMIARGQ